MSTSPTADRPEPPSHDAARFSFDDTGEPTGYDLGLAPIYEQPPTPVADERALSPALSTRGATAGFLLSLAGLVATPLGPWFTVPLLGTGIVFSASALTNCSRGTAAGHGRALVGFVLGIVGAFLTSILVLNIINGFSS